MFEPRLFSPPSSAADPSGKRRPGAFPLLGPEPTRLARYGAAVGVILIAFLLRLALFEDLDNRLPFAFFLPATMIAAWYGGLGPGVLTVAAGLLLGDYFFLPPHNALGPLGNAERTAIVSYGISSTLAVFLMENLHSRIRALECVLREQLAGAQRTSSPSAASGEDAIR